MMDELEYKRRILASQDRTIKKLDEMNADIANLAQFVDALKAENAALRASLEDIRANAVQAGVMNWSDAVNMLLVIADVARETLAADAPKGETT